MDHRERLTVPLGWVLLALGVVASITITCLFVTPPLVTAVITLAALAVTAGVLWTQSALVATDADGLQAGRAAVGWRWVGAARVLSGDEVEDRIRGRADVAAWRLSRPYLRRVVRVELDDPADPHPAWLIGTRRPDALVAAIEHHRARPGRADRDPDRPDPRTEETS